MRKFVVKQAMSFFLFFGMRKTGFKLGLLLMASTAIASSCSGNQTRCYEAADNPVDTVEHTCYKANNPYDTISRADTINVELEK